MPRIPNKIIINGRTFKGDVCAMKQAFKAGRDLSDEIIDLGGGISGNAWLKEDADLHLAKQEAICADLDKAMADCIARQRALNDERRKWFDGELDKMNP